MDEFWYNCIKEKYVEKVQLCYNDADTFIIHMKTKDFPNNVKNDE